MTSFPSKLFSILAVWFVIMPLAFLFFRGKKLARYLLRKEFRGLCPTLFFLLPRCLVFGIFWPICKRLRLRLLGFGTALEFARVLFGCPLLPFPFVACLAM